MSYLLILKPDAERDLQQAMEWYDEQRRGLGEEFVLEVEEALERISTNPHLHAIVHRDIRRAMTKRFPYGVFYIIENDLVVVLAVLHAKRDPVRWQTRR